MRVTKKDLKGKIKYFPLAVVQAMCEEQYRQTGNFDPSVFFKKPDASTDRNGFSWAESKEGYTFWSRIINGKNFILFYMYKGISYIEDLSLYKVTKKDLKGDLEGYPLEIVRAMLIEQVLQGNPMNIDAFSNYVIAGAENGGFDWVSSRQGREFWESVIGNRNFKRFYAEYKNNYECNN